MVGTGVGMFATCFNAPFGESGVGLACHPDSGFLRSTDGALPTLAHWRMARVCGQ